MKRSNVLKAGMLAGLMIFVAVHALAADPDTLYVRYIEGGVELAEAGSSQWTGAVVNTPLIEGDTVRTAATGRAELFMKDGSIVRIGKGSTMKVIAVEQNGVQFKLDRGMAYINAKGSKEVPLYFDTYSAAMDITTPAALRVDVYDDGTSEISVFSGMVQVAQQKGKMPVKAGEWVVLRADGSTPVLAGLRGVDEWQRWNTDRDRGMLAGHDTGESYAYLPDELRTYSSDLDANGQWVYTEEYDYVWVPTVITVSTWSPYRVGRWAWIRGSYVWIGYEPWGWAPYHYGRWVHHRRAGWCWVPPARGDVRWEPAHVAWVHSSKQVGWVPLAPGERYDRRMAPVINQTNVYNTYNNVTIERSVNAARAVYKNAAANSVVTMDRDRLLKQKAVNVNMAKAGTVGLRKVNLPTGVVPARAKGVQPQVAGRSMVPQGQPQVAQKVTGQTGASMATAKTAPAAVRKIDEKRPALQRSGISGTPGVGTGVGVNVPGSAATKTKAASVTQQRDPVIHGNTVPVKGKEAPAARQTPGEAVPLRDRIDNARKTDARTGQPGVQARTVPNASVDRRIDDGKGQGQKISQPVSRVPSTQRVEEKLVPVAPNANSNTTVGRTGPQGAAIQQRTPVVTTRPVQGSAPSNNIAVRAAPARTATAAGGPQTVLQKPVMSTQPAAQTVKAPGQPRQATQRVEVKPVEVRREKPAPVKAEPARQEAPKERANTAVSSPAVQKQQAPATTRDKGESGGNSKPTEANKTGKPQLQQNAAKR